MVAIGELAGRLSPARRLISSSLVGAIRDMDSPEVSPKPQEDGISGVECTQNWATFRILPHPPQTL